jgi:hypothetical protein
MDHPSIIFDHVDTGIMVGRKSKLPLDRSKELVSTVYIV